MVWPVRSCARGALLLLVSIAGCSGESTAERGAGSDRDGAAADGAARDAGDPDAGDLDAGDLDPLDGGPRDAGPRDGGPLDAGSLDGGPRDGGPPAGPRILYVSTDGDDARDGSAPARSVHTLTRVHALVAAGPRDRDVEVRIAPGTYHGQRVVWDVTMPDHTIRFVTAVADRTRPVFDGCSASGACAGGTWFTLRASSGRSSNIEFEYLRVTRYTTAISLNGSRAMRSTSNGSNRVFGCYFDRIGNGFAPSLPTSTAALRLVNSDDNAIENNHFVDVINTTSGALIHAIYAAHGSERNRIARNRFQGSTGDPVRFRDFSNGNVIADNRFIHVGTNAGYTDWYCDRDARTDCTSEAPECPSWDNQFRDNVLDGTWACGTLAVWELFQDDSTTGCAPPSATARRVRTSGNTQTTTPCSMD